MTKFNPENKKSLTYGDILDPIFKITDKEDAAQYKAAYIQWIMEDMRVSKENATETANGNIGYYAGYHNDPVVRNRINKLLTSKNTLMQEITLILQQIAQEMGTDKLQDIE